MGASGPPPHSHTAPGPRRGPAELGRISPEPFKKHKDPFGIKQPQTSRRVWSRDHLLLKASVWAVIVGLNKTLNIRLKHNPAFRRLLLWECININNTQFYVCVFMYMINRALRLNWSQYCSNNRYTLYKDMPPLTQQAQPQ